MHIFSYHDKSLCKKKGFLKRFPLVNESETFPEIARANEDFPAPIGPSMAMKTGFIPNTYFNKMFLRLNLVIAQQPF